MISLKMFLTRPLDLKIKQRSNLLFILSGSMLKVNVIVSKKMRERSGSVVECLTRDRGTAGSSLTRVTALWSLSKTHLS